MKNIYNKLVKVIILIFMKINKYLSSAYELFSTNNISMLPAYIAFFTMWSIVPIIIIWDAVEKIFPDISTSDAIETQMMISSMDFINVDSSLSDSSFIIIAVVIYLSSKPFMSIISASNYIYDLQDNSNYFKMKGKSIVLALLLLCTIILLLVIPVLGERLLMMIENIIGNVPFFDSLTNVKWPLTILYLIVVVFLIYSVSPSKRIKVKFFLPGTFFTTIGWLIVTYLYSIYVNEFANYAKIYSSFTSVIILMIWLYLISYILIIGLVINAAYFREKSNG